MGKYDRVRAATGWGIPGADETSRSQDEVCELIDLTRDGDPKVRKIALVNLCPCHVRHNFPEAWDRILEMTDDPEPIVRSAVVHMLADGSPRERQPEVLAAFESMRHDPDRKIRRTVHRVLEAYRRTGRVNIL
jgi:hypothetical protein